MKQRLTLYLFLFLFAVPALSCAQQPGNDSTLFKTSVYEVKKKKETIAAIGGKLKISPQLISSLNDSIGIDKVLPQGKKIIIPVAVTNNSALVSAVPQTIPVVSVDTDLIQNRILLTDATLDLNRALLQGIQASLDSLNVKDRSVIDEKNISITIHRMQRQRDKAMLTPVLLHMQDSLKTEIKKEEDEKTAFENMLSKNAPGMPKPVLPTLDSIVVMDTVIVAKQKQVDEVPVKIEKIVSVDTPTLAPVVQVLATDSLKKDTTQFSEKPSHIRPVIEANASAGPVTPAPIMHWETAKAIYYSDDTATEAQNVNKTAAGISPRNNEGDTAAYKPGDKDARAMSDTSRVIRAKYFYTRALKASNERNFKLAADYLKKAIDISPRYYDAWFALGETDAHLGFYTKALNEFVHCKNLDSSNASLYYKMGIVQLRLKQKAEAFNNFSRSLKIDSNYVPAILSRSMEYADRGLYRTAIRGYNKVLQIDPSYHTVFKSKAMAEYSLKNYSAAIDDFSRFLIFNETDASVFYYRGMSKIKLNDTLDACTDLSVSARLGFPAALKAMQVNCK